MDFIGITRTIDQAVYMLLNTLTIILWRVDAAIMGMSLYGYATQDWLTGSGGGVWTIMNWLLNTSGLFGVNTWTLFAGLALMLWGLSRIARPFVPFSPVHPGKLLFFFVISYVVISQGSTLMQNIEAWRLEAGSAIYAGVAGSGSANLNVPSIPTTSDPLAPPADLDGQSPIRGWEAVASSYFLATATADLHQAYPPEAFRVAYCLYNPDQPINEQTTENAQGCSPQRAWDEWDIGEVSILQDVLGLNVESLEQALEAFFGIMIGELDFDLDLITPLPLPLHHPENRELGIRQAQAGVARLALGLIVALFPIVEANISLMLALAASFVYLTLPIVLLFGFFLATEPLVNRLLMQFVAIIMRTLVINGIVALFMLLLMNTALSGSLTAYLGLVGVGLVGGFFLTQIATATMKESLGQSLGALGSVWMGTATGVLGQAAAQPAQAALGAAKIGAAAALLGAGSVRHFFSLAETSQEGARSGVSDLRQGAPEAMQYVDRQAARLPAGLARVAQASLDTPVVAETSRQVEPDAQVPGRTLLTTALAATLSPSIATVLTPLIQPATATDSGQSDPAQPPLTHWGDTITPAAVLAPTRPADAMAQRQADLDRWLAQVYQAQQTQRGLKQAGEQGRDLVGEELAWKIERATGRHASAETQAVLEAARQVAAEQPRQALVQAGRLTPSALVAVRSKLDADTARAFEGQTGTWDLAALTAAGLQQPTRVAPEEFRRAVATANSGWGQDSPGYTVPRALGLDPVAAGAHYTALNRFVRLSEAAGLSAAQRENLLTVAQTGQISEEMQADISASLQRQQQKGYGLGLTSAELIASAQAMPATLTGPEQVWTTLAKSRLLRQPGEERTEAKPGRVGDMPGPPPVPGSLVRPAHPRVPVEKAGDRPTGKERPLTWGQALKTPPQGQVAAGAGQRDKILQLQSPDKKRVEGETNVLLSPDQPPSLATPANQPPPPPAQTQIKTMPEPPKPASQRRPRVPDQTPGFETAHTVPTSGLAPGPAGRIDVTSSPSPVPARPGVGAELPGSSPVNQRSQTHLADVAQGSTAAPLPLGQSASPTTPMHPPSSPPAQAQTKPRPEQPKPTSKQRPRVPDQPPDFNTIQSASAGSPPSVPTGRVDLTGSPPPPARPGIGAELPDAPSFKQSSKTGLPDQGSDSLTTGEPSTQPKAKRKTRNHDQKVNRSGNVNPHQPDPTNESGVGSD